MFTLIAAAIAAIVSIVTNAMGIQQQQRAEITEGYLNDRAFEQNKTLAYFNLKTEKDRASLIIIGLLAIGIFVVMAILITRKKS